MMIVPPESAATKLTLRLALPVLIDEMEGALGAVRGVAPADCVEVAPVPAMFVAETRNTYSVPLERPVTVVARFVDTPSLKVVQLVPLLEDHSTT